jgi:hypothetical protein
MGRGCPDRIAGDDIPIASRIIMFDDTIDDNRAPRTDAPDRGRRLRELANAGGNSSTLELLIDY